MNEVFQNELARITRDLPCSARHPENDARCVLRMLTPHTKHKTELSQRWESQRDAA